MAIAYDATSSGSGNGVGPFTVAHTCSGSDRVLCVSIAVYDTGDVVTGVTYNSVALTPIGSASNGQFTVSQWYLIAPATGANNISVSVSGNVFDIGIAAVSLTGAHQTSAIGTQATGSGTDTTPTTTVTSAADEIIIDGLIINNSGTLSVGAAQTARVNAATGGGFIKYASSTATGNASEVMSWSNTTSQAWAIVATPFKPSGGATGQPATKRVGGIPYMSSSFSPRVW